MANRCYLDYWSTAAGLEIVWEHQASRNQFEQADCCEDFLSGNSLDKEGRALWAPLAATEVQQRWEAAGRPPLLKLSHEHIQRGRERLAALGIPPDAKIVTLHVRESGFHGDLVNRLQCLRNGDFASYIPAIRSIAERGHYVVRMGDPTMTKAPKIDGLVDYAHSSLRSDWMDVFLCGYGQFHIGTQSGLSLVPSTFGVPVVMTNWTTWGTPPWYGSDIFISKHFWSERLGRRLTLDEILDSELAYSQMSATFHRHGVRLINNGPEEILDAVQEMLDRTEGRLVYADEDDRANRRVRDIAARHNLSFNARVSRSFLQNNEHFFELDTCSEVVLPDNLSGASRMECIH